MFKVIPCHVWNMNHSCRTRPCYSKPHQCYKAFLKTVYLRTMNVVCVSIPLVVSTGYRIRLRPSLSGFIASDTILPLGWTPWDRFSVEKLKRLLPWYSSWLWVWFFKWTNFGWPNGDAATLCEYCSFKTSSVRTNQASIAEFTFSGPPRHFYCLLKKASWIFSEQVGVLVNEDLVVIVTRRGRGCRDLCRGLSSLWLSYSFIILHGQKRRAVIGFVVRTH